MPFYNIVGYWMGYDFFVTRMRLGVLPREPRGRGFCADFFCFFDIGGEADGG